MTNIDYSRPFAVRILEDCRPTERYGPSGDLTGKYAVCIGLEEDTPRIETPFGDVIYGDQCWWGVAADFEEEELEKILRAVDATKEKIISQIKEGNLLPPENLDTRIN